MVDTKVDGFLAMTHLWAGEAVYHEEPVQLVYISSCQAIDPGVSVPGYAISNWAVLQLPKVLSVNLGRSAGPGQRFSVMYPFVRTVDDRRLRRQRAGLRALAAPHAGNPRGRRVAAGPARPARGGDQPRHVRAACEATRASQSDAAGGTDGGVAVTWKRVRLDVVEERLAWSAEQPLRYS